MKKEDLLKTFAQMSSEDQEAIRAELIGKVASRGAWDPMAMCQDMMEKIKASGDPVAMCRDMMEKMKAGGDPMTMVKDMTEKMKAGEDPWTVCREMMESTQGKCC